METASKETVDASIGWDALHLKVVAFELQRVWVQIGAGAYLWGPVLDLLPAFSSQVICTRLFIDRLPLFGAVV